jgi:hypothetical protein
LKLVQQEFFPCFFHNRAHLKTYQYNAALHPPGGKLRQTLKK